MKNLMVKFILISSFLFSADHTFAFSKKMENYKVTFNQKRKVGELEPFLTRMELDEKEKQFFKKIINRYRNNDLPLLEFNGSEMIFKYRNQKSTGRINLSTNTLSINEHIISLSEEFSPIKLYKKISSTLSNDEGGGMLIFLTSETPEKAPLLNDNLEALFWGLSTLVAQNPLVLPKSPRRFIASEKE